MSDDVAGLMDALDLKCAHVLGISMGGMIAQEVALRHPGRVRGLILGCTHCGGRRAVRAEKEIGEIFSRYAYTGSVEAGMEMAGCLFTKQTMTERPEVVSRYRDVSSRFPVDPDVLKKQFKAIQCHDACGKVRAIRTPTLVITGGDDVLIPPENSKILADEIPEAKLEVIPGGGHQFIIEKEDVFNRKVIEFLTPLSLTKRSAAN
jgi:pimeloyl-ACP methyl ester carboxylesterase